MSLEKTGVQAVIEGLSAFLSGMNTMQTAVDSTSKNMKSAADSTDKASKSIDQAGKSADTASGKFGGMGNALANLAKLAAGLGLGALFSNAVKGAMEEENVLLELRWALKTTKGAAGISEKALLDLGEQLGRTTRFTHEQVNQIEAMDLRFTSIGKNVFPRVVRASLDLAAKFGNVQTASLAVGKAMEDTTGGVTTLRREGIMLTDAQEKQIKQYEALGQHEKAQIVILEAIEKGYGGLAEAAGTTTAGKLDILRHKFDEVGEAVGAWFTPALGAAADALGGIIDSLGPAAPVLFAVAGGFGALAVFSGPLAGILAAVATGLSGLLVPLAVIGGSVILFRKAWDDNFLGIPTMIQGIIDGVQVEFGNLKSAVDDFFAILNAPPKGAQLLGIGTGTATAALDPFVERLINAITTAGPIILMRLGQLLESLRIPIEATFAQIGKNLEKSLTDALNGLTETVRGYGSKANNFGDALAEFISSAWPRIDQSMMDLPGKLSLSIGKLDFSGPGGVFGVKLSQAMYDALANIVGGPEWFQKLMLGKRPAGPAGPPAPPPVAGPEATPLPMPVTIKPEAVADAIHTVVAQMPSNTSATTSLIALGASIGANVTDGIQPAIKPDVLTPLQTASNSANSWVITGDGSKLLGATGQGITDALKGKLGDLAAAMKNSVVAGLQSIIGILRKMGGIPFIGGLATDLAGQLQGAIGKAAGGAVEAGTLYKVGERGTEAFVPQVNGTIIPHNILDNILPGSMPIPALAGGITNNYYNSNSMGDINMNGVSGTDDSIRRYSMLRALGRIK